MAEIAAVFVQQPGPEWLTDSVWPGLVATDIFLAGMYGLSAPANGVGPLPRREMIHLGWTITGAIAGGAVVYLLFVGVPGEWLALLQYICEEAVDDQLPSLPAAGA